jgi:hypothetical protein
MSGTDNRSRPAKRRPALERLAERLLLGRESGLAAVVADDAINVLNERERAALRRIERGAVTRAAVAGALSGLVSAVAELIAVDLFGPSEGFTRLDEHASFWGVVLGATVVATLFEIGFLTVDALRSVHAMARAAGVNLAAGSTLERSLLTPLARAALELPNPPETLFGVHPYREVSRLRLILATLVYKAKISVTNFAVKLCVRRVLGRAAVRAWLPLLGVPVTAAWNAWVVWRVLRQARLRIMGPFAGAEYLSLLLPDGTVPSPLARVMLARAVGVTVVKKHDLHPNLVALLEHVLTRCAAQEPGDLGDCRRFIDELSALDPAERQTVLHLLAVAVVIDGHLGRREVRVLEQGLALSGRRLDRAALAALCRDFVAGRPASLASLVRLSAAQPGVASVPG